MSHMQEIIERGNAVLIGNYARYPVCMKHGEGALVWDADGKRYIDLFAGFGAAIVGHCHPALIRAAMEQSTRLWHVGNTFYTEPQIEYGQRLNKHAFAGRAFFCHSGLEANEAACKLARLRGNRQFTPRRWKILSLTKCFHGRSLAMISATGNPRVKDGFEPMVEGFSQVEAGDFDALERAVDDQTAGIIVEVIQGEGGMNEQAADYLLRIRRLCDSRGLTLIFDEVWTGVGRTGRWFAYQHLAHPDGGFIEPDIMTLGKAAGGGLPVGVMYARPALAALLTPGTHGCTLGANPICMAVACAVFDVIARDGLVRRAEELGRLAVARLGADRRIADRIVGVRGRGLMLGIELKDQPQKIVERGLERGVIINLTAGRVIRLAPPLNIPGELWEEGLEIVTQLIAAG